MNIDIGATVEPYAEPVLVKMFDPDRLNVTVTYISVERQ